MAQFVTITAKAARVNAGLSVAETSRRLGISKATLNNYESGRTSPPWELVERMSELYRYPMSGFSFALQSPKSVLRAGK